MSQFQLKINANLAGAPPPAASARRSAPVERTRDDGGIYAAVGDDIYGRAMGYREDEAGAGRRRGVAGRSDRTADDANARYGAVSTRAGCACMRGCVRARAPTHAPRPPSSHASMRAR